MSGPFDDRRRALEESYFAEKDKQLLEQLRNKQAVSAAADELASATGITDQKVIADLERAGVGPETLAALGLVPLVEVAWSDGNVDKKEQDAVLKAAVGMGVAESSASYQLLRNWLERRPAIGAVNAWKEYVRSLVKVLQPDQVTKIRNAVVSRAKSVAEAAGGILGLGNRISAPEQATLDEFAKAFDVQ